MSDKLALPQYDKTNNNERQQALAKMQKLYAYTLTYDGFIATINTLPDREKQSCGYRFRLVMNLAGILLSIGSVLSKWIRFKLLKKPFTRFDDYFFYNHSPFPNETMRENFLDNQYLGYQRVAGMNPVVLEGVGTANPIPATMKISAESLGISEEKWQQLVNDNRLYMTNYAMLKPLMENPGKVDGQTKYVMPCCCLYQMDDQGLLMPLVAQMDVTAETDEQTNPLILPSDPRWRMARTFLQAADGTHQELWTHATRIHYIMESIIMISWRQLSERHPLMALLKPHLKLTLSINVNPLFEPAPDGSIPSFGKMFACDNETLVAFMAQGMREYSFKEFILPTELKNRNVLDERLVYPYRDDGVPIWQEVKRFVKEYLGLWYKDDNDVLRDTELQAWAEELGGPREENNCGLTDFPTRFEKVDQLVEIVAHIVFVATAHHSSVHYPQYECAGYPPNLPFSAYQPWDTNPDEYQSEPGLVKFFPTYSMAWEQAFIFYLTNFRVNKMGQYPLGQFSSEAKGVIKRHQKALQALHQSVIEKNRQRPFPYVYMDTDRVPNSVTV